MLNLNILYPKTKYEIFTRTTLMIYSTGPNTRKEHMTTAGVKPIVDFLGGSYSGV